MDGKEHIRRFFMSSKIIKYERNDQIDSDGYYRHGECGRIILRVTKDTNIENVYCYCRTCRKEVLLKNIVNGQIADSPEKRISMA